MSKLAQLLIRFYQRFISPLTPPRCKYYPTCSSYAMDSYRMHGFFMGTVLTVWRLLRCNPWSLGGVDYVPERVRIDYFRVKRNKNLGK
ncbi:MAG: membrane protein insertion efficiency factor YidD [Ruminococcus sp.]|nr:membrane protein insertion efficiency factor YidD [Ruminococcus sp.]